MVKRLELLEELRDYETGNLPVEKLHITEEMVRKAITFHKSLELARVAYRKLSTQQASNPERTLLTSLEGTSLYCMSSYVNEFKTITVKIARFNPHNPQHNLPSVMATVHIYDARTGQELAEVEAETLTVLRTAAGSAVATDLLAREDATVLGIFGTGRQAEAHVPAIREVRKIQQAWAYSRNQTSRENFARKTSQTNQIPVIPAKNPEEVVQHSDILVLATNSREPLFPGRLVKPGTHVNAIGAALPTTREVDTELVKRSSIVVDFKPQALKTYGDIIIPLQEGAIKDTDLLELGELLVHPVVKERTEDAITLFKSGGVAVLDAVFAEYILSPYSKTKSRLDIYHGD